MMVNITEYFFFINITNNRTINYKDILFFTNNYLVSFFNINNNWEIMWSKKIDFLENYIEKKDSINSLVKPLCYYYIGLAENALQCLKKVNNYYSLKYSISHKRIKCTDTLIELYNPINFIIDNKCRDISEYLKSTVSESNNINLYDVIGSLYYTENEFRLLIARLLFPSYFFDKLDLLNDNKLSKKEILHMYDFTLKYESFLCNVLNIIKKIWNINIPNIDWIKR